MQIQSDLQVGSPVSSIYGINTPPNAVVLATSHQIKEAITKLAKEITPWLEERPLDPVVLVCLLEGGRFFADQLNSALKQLSSAYFTRVDLKVSTRDLNGTPLSQPEIKGNTDLLISKRILIADDILDSGTTLSLIDTHLRKNASELRSCVLIEKLNPEISEEELSKRPKTNYVGLSFTDSRWFSGAGMDMPGDPEGKVRNADYVIAYPPLFD